MHAKPAGNGGKTPSLPVAFTNFLRWFPTTLVGQRGFFLLEKVAE